MSLLRYLGSAAAVVAAVNAQNNDECSTTATLTIENAVAASSLAACETFSGSIAIATNVPNTIDIPGVQEIDGDLIVNNATDTLTQLSAGSLQSITGALRLSDSNVLNSISFPQLTRVGVLSFISVPGLSTTTFSSGLEELTNVTIQNTNLNDLSFLSSLNEVQDLSITSNQFVRELDLPLQEASGAVVITNNNPALTVSFPQLRGAARMAIGNVSSLELPALQYVNGSFDVLGGELPDFAAPNLTLSGDLTFSDNLQIANISAPALERIDGRLKVSQNPLLLELNGFPALEVITGALDLSGNFTTFSLPAINDVQGATNIQSSGDIEQSCTTIEGANNGDALKGEPVTCESNRNVPGGLGQENSGSNGNGGNQNAAGRFEISAALISLSGLAALAWL